jgi:Domain of unknown function (DUF5666)
MKTYKVHIIWALVAIVALIGGYFWGRSTGTAAIAAGRSGYAGYAGALGSSTARRAGGAAATGAGLVSGQITAVGSSSLTVQLANGNSDVVLYSSATPVTEPTAVPASTLTTGTNVMVVGTSNSDGSVSATSIQVRPAGSGSGFSGGGAAEGEQEVSSSTGQ